VAAQMIKTSMEGLSRHVLVNLRVVVMAFAQALLPTNVFVSVGGLQEIVL
jgi:hypothetical protein